MALTAGSILLDDVGNEGVTTSWTAATEATGSIADQLQRRRSKLSGTAALRSSITQYGITWTLSEAKLCGQYVNGDWWVVGSVTVASISPGAEVVGADTINGSQINPTAGGSQSYDSRSYAWNGALLIEAPIVLDAGDSLVSTESISSFPYVDVIGSSLSTGRSYVKTAAVLTCVSEAPSAPAFRPTYFAGTKTQYLASEVQWNLLPTFTVPEGAPSLATYERRLQRPWIDQGTGWTAADAHPADNMPNYGRDICGVIGDAACLLCLNYTQAEKSALLYSLIQIGIDNYHAAVATKDMWESNGGHGLGRKFPIQFAGLMLGNSAMVALNDYAAQEDMSTYDGDDYTENLWTEWQDSEHAYAANVMYCLNGKDALDTASNPWRHEHRHPSTWDESPFPNNPGSSPIYPYVKHEGYRRLATQAMPGQTIAARLLGMTTGWDYAPYFAYVDRWMYEDDAPLRAAIEAEWGAAAYGSGLYNGQTAWSAFAAAMYLAHR